MRELDVINDMLALTQEAPLNELDLRHPFVVSGLRLLNNVNEQIQNNKGKGWWFNRELDYTLAANVQGEIVWDEDMLSIVSNDPQHNYVQRGGKLYDTDNSTFTIGQNITATIVRKVNFDDLPVSAQEAVAAEAVYRFQSNYESEAQKTALLKDSAKVAKTALVAESISKDKINMQKNPQVGTFLSGFAARSNIRTRRF